MTHHDEMSVAALVDEIRIARRTMSSKNRLHALLGKCEAAVVHLAIQLHESKTKRAPWWRVIAQRVRVARAKP